MKELTSYVYFLQSFDGKSNIKIGKSINPLIRAKHFKMQIIGLMEGGLVTEAYIHQQFKHLEVKREFFLPEKELLKFIEDNSLDLDNLLKRENRKYIHSKDFSNYWKKM